jgi:hypothetical protein
MGVLDKIDFSYGATADASVDFRLLDAPCDHLIRNEQPTFDINDLVSPIPYSGLQYNTFNYGSQMDPTASVEVVTRLPYVNDGSLVMFESIIQDDLEVTEEFVVASGNTTDFFSLQFPPKTNTTYAQQKIFVDNTNYKLINFTRYMLAQLYGNIKFTNVLDIGQTVIFKYLPDKKIIPQKNLDQTSNYEFLGLDQYGKGRFNVFGRAFRSTKSKLLFKYTTNSISCIKCGGRNEINDIIFDQNGRIELTYDFAKLIQDFFKRLLTEKGSDPFSPSEGSSMSIISGVGKRDPELIDTLIKNEIISILNSIRLKQGLQQDIQGISLGEQIYQISNVYVRTINTTDLQVEVEVLSKSGITQQIKAVIQRG